MRLLYENKLENATLTASAELSAYPIDNVTNRFLEKIYKPGDTSTTVTILFSMDTDISAVAVGFQSASSGTYTLKNSGGTTLLTGSISLTYETDITYFTETTCRSIELAFTGTIDMYIGGISAGVYLDLPGININPRIDYYTRDESVIVRGGQTTGYQTAPLFRYRATLGIITLDQRKGLESMTDTVGNYKPFYGDLYETAHDVARPIYCLCKGNGQFNRDSRANDYSTTIVLEEVR